MRLSTFASWICLALALAAVVGCGGASAQVPVCSTGRVIGAGPEKNATLQVCLPALRDDPAVQALLAQLNQLQASNADARRSIDKLLKATQQTSGGLSPRHVEALVEAIARRVVGGSQRSDERTLREIERLRLAMDDLQDHLVAARARPDAAARLNDAVAGPAGDAISRLDFEQAGRIIDSLDRIERDVKLPCASDPELLRITRADALRSLETLRSLRAEARCAAGWQKLSTYYESAQRAEKRGDLNAACLTYEEFSGRTMQVVSELSSADAVAQSTAMLRAQLETLAKARFNAALTQAQGTDRNNALRYARTDKLRADIGQADRMVAAAEATAAAGRMADGAICWSTPATSTAKPRARAPITLRRCRLCPSSPALPTS